MSHLTPTQTRILALLSDGRPHTRAELKACLSDDLAGPSALRKQISELRPKLEGGHEIVCVYRRATICYQRIVRYTLTGE